MNNLRQSTADGLRWLGLSGGATAVFQLLQMAVLGRLLGPGAFGTMAVILIVTGFANALRNAGVPEYVVHKQNLPTAAVSALFWLNLCAGVLMGGLTWMISPWLALFFDAPDLVSPLHAICAAFLITSFSAIPRAILQSNLSFRPIAIADTMAAAVNLSVATSIALFSDAGVWALVGGYLASITVRASIISISAREYGFRPGLTNRWQSITEFASFGSYLTGSTILDFIREKADQLVVGTLFGTQVLGFYSMANNLVLQPSLQINSLISGVAFPILSKLQRDRDRMAGGFLKLLRLSATLTAPLLLGAAAVAPTAVPLILGPEWLPMVPLLMVLAVYATLRGLVSTGGALIMANGKAKWAFRWNAAMLLVGPPVILCSGWLGDAMTVAVTITIMQCALVGINYRVMIRPLTGPVGAQFAKSLTPLALAAAMALCVWWGAGAMGFADPTLTDLVFQVGAGVSIYLVIMALFQRETIRDAVFVLRHKGLSSTAP